MNRYFTVIARLRNAKWEILPSPHVRFKHLHVFVYRAVLLIADCPLLIARPGSNIASGGEGRFSATARFSVLAGTGGWLRYRQMSFIKRNGQGFVIPKQ